MQKLMFSDRSGLQPYCFPAHSSPEEMSTEENVDINNNLSSGAGNNLKC